MKKDFDFIIVGSGFGGSVSALRLSQKGYKVLVVEKGKWYESKDFPKSNWNLRKWLWLPSLRFFGIMKLTIFRHIAILSGTGVGGGSLVYANTLPIPKTTFFKTGSWSKLADWENELKPHYETAYKMLGADVNPKLFDGDLALKELAKNRGIEHQFEATKVAVFFGEEGKSVPDPYFNGEGPDRSGCIHCGGCMTGCRYNAKNTLDKNYLYLAQKEGAEIIAEKEVVDIVPIDSLEPQKGYKVTIRDSTKLFKKRSELSCNNLIMSGGVMGTIKLLLKLKKKGSLPNISNRLGHDIRTNNETLISVSSLEKHLNVSKGIAIGSILHVDDNTHLEICRYNEGSGFWKILHLPMSQGKTLLSRLIKTVANSMKSPIRYFRSYWLNSWSKKTVILLFMQSVDSTLRLKRGILGNLVSKVSTGTPPSADIPESLSLTKEYANVVDGNPSAFALETLAGIPSTAHILGGAVMADSPKKGVINKHNKVFGYENMYIIDGSMISANPGVNPSLSITAIAEHAMSQIKPKDS